MATRKSPRPSHLGTKLFLAIGLGLLLAGICVLISVLHLQLEWKSFQLQFAACAYDAKGLLKSAIRFDNPVLFCEPKQLYQTKQEIPDDIYESDYTIPIGLADVKRPGRDVTLVAIGLMVPRALEAAEKLAAEGIDVEVIDPRTIAPLDKGTIFASIRKTHMAAVVEEGNKTAGIGAELAAMFQEELYDELDGPVARIAALDVPMPYNIRMEKHSIPSVDRICASIRAMF